MYKTLPLIISLYNLFFFNLDKVAMDKKLKIMAIIIFIKMESYLLSEI